MAHSLSFRITGKTGQFPVAFDNMGEDIASAATKAINVAAEAGKKRGRSDIARAGFGVRWQNTFRANVYPKGGQKSVDAAAWFYHKISYAGVFEEGATIRGKPILWVPLSSTPKKIGTRRMTAENARIAFGKLYVIKRPGKPPLLAARAALGARSSKLSLTALKKGAASGKGTRLTPLFVGLDQVTIRKKFHITQILNQVASELPRHYYANLRTD